MPYQKEEPCLGQKIVCMHFKLRRAPSSSCPFQDKYIVFDAAAVLDIHLETLPDILEDVDGHDVQEGVLEDLHKD